MISKNKRRPVFHRLGEDLEQITFVVAIDQDAEPLQRLEIFIDVADPIQAPSRNSSREYSGTRRRGFADRSRF